MRQALNNLQSGRNDAQQNQTGTAKRTNMLFATEMSSHRVKHHYFLLKDSTFQGCHAASLGGPDVSKE